MTSPFRSAYVNPPPADTHGCDCSKDACQTKQEFKQECDINVIMKRYARGGDVPALDGALYGDFSEVASFQEAQEIILHARRQFEALPSDVRERFANDPETFLRFANDVGNKEEMRKLGLLKPEPPAPVKPPPMEVVVVPNADGSTPVLK